MSTEQTALEQMKQHLQEQQRQFQQQFAAVQAMANPLQQQVPQQQVPQQQMQFQSQQQQPTQQPQGFSFFLTFSSFYESTNYSKILKKGYLVGIKLFLVSRDSRLLECLGNHNHNNNSNLSEINLVFRLIFCLKLSF